MNKKIIAIVLAVVILATAIVAGTLAYLTDKQTVTNTFTLGKVAITLTEPSGQSYKIVPGSTATKNPIVTVDADSEDCFVFVTYEKNKGSLVHTFDECITFAIDEEVWTQLSEGVYYAKVTDFDEDVELNVIDDTTITFTTTIDQTDMAALTEDDNPETPAPTMPTLTFTAYAIQADNLTGATGDDAADAAIAWTALQAAYPAQQN